MLKNQSISNNTSLAYPVTESSQSAVSWGAVIAGAVIAAALTATLITGGTGLGFLAISPWHNSGASGSVIAMGTVAWLFITQIIAYGIAGYVAGRLRSKWTDVRGDEIYFRDTAHGFLVWALSSIVGLVLLGSVAASIVSGTAQAGATLAGASSGAATAVAGAQMMEDETAFSMDYYTDSLLRPQSANTSRSQNDSKEVSTILTRSIVRGELSAEDKDYLIRLVAQRADISESEAQARLNQVTERAQQAIDTLEAQAREAADEARKAAAIFALWAFASLLIGAFVASFAATCGGRARDL